ncbi:NADP-dependent malic enzyme [Spodoptera frugiperda]|uniref:NADP-dependent malic enzyme n=1 Tax=Spodoptera frugiperda TaxID=7108 RepID=A0A9R0F5I6_SPOFR|nr:NADP-dependent malic enzyme [Spodoptera frugiperda]
MIPIMCRTFCKTKLRQIARFSTNAVNFGVAGDVVTANLTKGIDHLRNPRLNKGLAFTLEERQAFGIHGLLSSEFRTLEQQLAICRLSVDRYRSPLNKYLYLAELLDTNETLFYCLIHDDVEKYMPLINSPTVGIACLRFGLVYKMSRGLFVTIHDKGHVIDVLKNWPERDVRVVVVTDGERILGLGDLGAHGMGVAQGKITLLTALGGIKPHQCMPVCLDVGTNSTSLIEDPLYIGIREARYPRKDYDDLVCEFFAACKKLYGPQTLIMMEDLAMHNAYRLLTRFRDDYCVFNDDIQATAATVLSGLMVACNRITNQKLKDNTYLFFGAGSTGVGIANLLCDAMMEEGLTSEAARNRCYLFDIDGLLSRKRRAGIPAHAKDFARDLEPETDFQACIKKFKATCIIGTSTSGSAFTPSILREVAKNTERPLIFPLSNPTIQSECSAQEAYDYTQGRCIFASGSPFPPVAYKGKKFYPGQANNYYIFPGIALGVVAANAFRVTDDMFITAAKTLARNVTEEDIKVGRIYPHVNQMNNISLSIAADIVSLACDLNLTYLCPRPSNYKEFVREQSYEFKYSTNIPRFYSYPEKSIIKLKNIEILHKGLLPRKRRPRPRSDPPILV